MISSATLQEELDQFFAGFVDHKYTQDVFNGLDFILKRRHFGEFCPSMLLTGGSGAGKTAAINHYYKTHLQENNVVITRVKETLKETLIYLINVLGLYRNHRANGSEFGLIDYAIKAMKQSNLHLLIIEEVQELFEYSSQRERQKIRDDLKRISDECRLPMLFVGMPSSKLILEDSQWDRRIKVRAELPYFVHSDDKSVKNYLEVLQGFQNLLPLPTCPKLNDFEMALRLLASTKGIMCTTKEIIAEAFSIALHRSSKDITLNDFAEAYALFNGSSAVNPFLIEFEQLTLPEIASYDGYSIDEQGEMSFDAQVFKNIPVKDLLR